MDERKMILMDSIRIATYSQWLNAQRDRTDIVGDLSRFWGSFEHGRVSSLAGVTRAIQKQGDILAASGRPEPELAHWIAAATKEYRLQTQENALGVAVSPQLEAVAKELAGLRFILEQVRDHLGIPAVASVPDLAAVAPIAERAKLVHAWSQPALEPDEAEAAAADVADGASDRIEQQIEGWQAWYDHADHTAAVDE